MKTRLLALGAFSALGLILAACSGGGSAKGKAVFAIADDAADMGAVTSVKVTIDGVRVHGQGAGWTTVSTKAETFDLLELRAKHSAKLLAQADLDAKGYDQMELDVSKVVVVDAKGEHEAKLPSNTLQIKGNLDVRAQSTAAADFDFLADQSLHTTADGRYILAPVIRLETRANADVQVQSNNDVTISGGTTTINTQVGMDIDGNVGVGLKITSNAVLGIEGSGKVVQTKGQVVIGGVVKSVDSASGTVTVTTKGGTDLILKLGGSATVQPGSEVVATYDAETKADARVNATLGLGLGLGSSTSAPPAPTATMAPTSTPPPSPMSAKATVSGTLKSVNAAAGTLTIAAQGGTEVVLTVASDTKLVADGAAATLVTLATKVGSQVTAEYNAQTKTATSVSAQAQMSASVSASGTLKAVNALANTVTITTQGGVELVLNLTAQSKVLVNGYASTAAALVTMVGRPTTVEYNAETKAVVSLNIQG